MDFNLKGNEFSSWVDYPERYKFFSLHIKLDPDIYKIDRATYDLLDLIGDVGGVLEFCVVLFKLICMPFALIRLRALITNRIFIIP